MRYQCRSCTKWFSFNRKAPKISIAALTIAHIDGTPFRSLASQHGISVGSAYNYVHTGLSSLPHCADITRELCSRFCGILLVDGKYVAVKHHDRKIPVIYGIDYTTHDIPHYIFSVAENYPTCLSFFKSLRLLNYPLQAVVCDDNRNIYESCKHVYPQAAVQLCWNHFKQNLRLSLGVATNPTYVPFMLELESLFSTKRSLADFDSRARYILTQFYRDPICAQIMLDIEKRKHLLLGYLGVKGVPVTTNLIESFNSHLQGRLETIKGFENTSHADTWLNGYFLRRRTKSFTSCGPKFRRLNGKTSLSQTKNPDADTPILF